ncbi:transglutaminase domain-containing protein [Lacinutrix jangbogonensis]|uniref:transglutaminase domain-containing protein n=1 Tax=Lacinutrix jangbogonensis TaxID=1469557 RepID=UPI00053DD490|nr:transglutaminase domain-containing protein [Lacinutrix jangbogonensis]
MRNALLLLFIFIFNTTIAQVSDFKAVNFTIADNVAKLNKGASLENLPVLAHKLTHKLPTKVEKFRAIYTWVCNNIEGDHYQYEKVSRKRKKYKNDSIGLLKWNNEYKKIAFKTLVKKKKTMCTGYAYLIKELCFFANIDSKIVDGYGRSIVSNIEKLDKLNHSWNAVKLDNKWYLCDATWSSGYTSADNIFINEYNEGYFLTEPILFAKNHYPLDKKWLLNDTLIQSDFIASPLVYGETFKHKVVPVSPEKMAVSIQKQDHITFSFKTLKNSTKDKVSLVQFNGNNEHAFKIFDLKSENGITSFKHQFNRKGFYDVHLKINNDIVATYTIEVTKS